MTRWSKVFCLGIFLFSLALSAAQAESGVDFVPAPISPELQDSLNGAKEPTLQQILDGLGYDIDVIHDLLPTQVWVTMAGQYGEVMLAELASYASETSSGWYGHGSPADTHVIFRGANDPGDTAVFTITGCDSYGLFIHVPGAGEKCPPYVYYTEKSLNPDHKDHAKVYCSRKRPNEYVIAWEDCLYLGDQDFNDLVLVFQTPNRAPVLDLPENTNFLICETETVCFNISAYDDCGDTISIAKIEGPGVFDQDAGTCCFLPASVNSAYEFVFVATDCFGAADTETVVITVEFNQPPQIVCPDDDSVNAGDLFVSSNFSTSDPKCDPVVNLCGITPTPTHMPIKEQRHVEWRTDCADAGKVFTICLEVTDKCGAKDTCYFEVTVYNRPPQITCPDDDSVNHGDLFVSSNFSSSDPKCDPVVNLCGITPTPTHMPIKVQRHVEWRTDCADAGKIFTICLEATDKCGSKDTCYFEVTVYNRPPQITCPDDTSVNGRDTLVSTDFSVTDPDGDSVLVTLLDINPPAPHNPTIVENHVEWVTTGNENGGYIIRLLSTDPCGAKDTCEFTVNVYNQPPQFTCPESRNLQAGDTLVSSDFSVTDPDGDSALVTFLDINPSATNNPTIVQNHIEWITTCQENGGYVIRLVATDPSGVKDTCEFTVNVYNQPPHLTCPEGGSVQAGDTLVSSDFSATDPDGDSALVTFLDINPPAPHNPTIVENHVEWVTTGNDNGGYLIRLIATDPCGAKDTCEFMVNVSQQDFTISATPEDQYVIQGHLMRYLVKLTSLFGFDDPCTLFVSGLPNPPDSGVFDQSVLTPTDSTGLNVYTTPSTDTGLYTLTITAQAISGGKATPLEHSIQVILRVIESSDVEDGTDNLNSPKSFALFQNQPNPFNPETRISYYLPKNCEVKLIIYNILGQNIRTLFDGCQEAGLQTLFWDGRDNHGVQQSSGIYFYRLQADDFHQARKMTLTK